MYQRQLTKIGLSDALMVLFLYFFKVSVPL